MISTPVMREEPTKCFTKKDSLRDGSLLKRHRTPGLAAWSRRPQGFAAADAALAVEHNAPDQSANFTLRFAWPLRRKPGNCAVRSWTLRILYPSLLSLSPRA